MTRALSPGAHRELQRIGRARTRLDLEEGHWMLAGLRGRVHWRLGYASFAEYAERLLGHSPRTTREKLRVAAALEKLPETAAAAAEGQLLWWAARELMRMAKLRRGAGGALDDDAAILQMARVVLGGGASGRGDGDAGRASYQIAIGVCAECGRAEQERPSPASKGARSALP